MGGGRTAYDRRNRWLWIGLAAPGAIWLIVLFVVPFYVMLAVAGGRRELVLPDAGPGLESAALVDREPDRSLARYLRRRSVLGPPALRTRDLYRRSRR